MQQIGRALDQAVAGRQRPTKFQEARVPHAAVRKIGREIIQRPFLAIASGEQDADAARRVRAGIFVGEMRSPLVVERDQIDLADGLPRARQKNIKDRQGAADLPGVQIDLHQLGDEEAEAQDRAQRALDIVERGSDTTPRQFREIGHRTDRLERAQYVGRGLGIKRVRVQEIRTAEHVKHRRPRRSQIGVRPAADFRKLALLKLGERRIEEPGVALPGRILRQRRQRRIRRWRHPRKETRGVVGGHSVGGAPSSRGCEEHGCSNGCNSHRLKHLHSRLGDAVGKPGMARLRKTA